MRTLLNESLPPQSLGKQTLSPSDPATSASRTFPQNAVLGNLDNLVEVGLDGTVMATPGAGVGRAKPALERGMTISQTPSETETARPTPAGQAAPIV